MQKTVHMIVDQLGNFIVYIMCIFLFWSANVTFSTKTTNVSKSLKVEKNLILNFSYVRNYWFCSRNVSTFSSMTDVFAEITVLWSL